VCTCVSAVLVHGSLAAGWHNFHLSTASCVKSGSPLSELLWHHSFSSNMPCCDQCAHAASTSKTITSGRESSRCWRSVWAATCTMGLVSNQEGSSHTPSCSVWLLPVLRRVAPDAFCARVGLKCGACRLLLHGTAAGSVQQRTWHLSIRSALPQPSLSLPR
jgi:hypothetical protein